MGTATRVIMFGPLGLSTKPWKPDGCLDPSWTCLTVCLPHVKQKLKRAGNLKKYRNFEILKKQTTRVIMFGPLRSFFTPSKDAAYLDLCITRLFAWLLEF